MTIPPIVRQVVVAASAERAHEAWTREIGAWWPLATHSVHQHDTTVAFVDGRIVESTTDGATSVWGRVVEDQPPHRIVFSWHPGRGPETAGTVTVEFVPVAGGRTLVRLTHTGWEALADPLPLREDYHGGWRVVLAAYAGRIVGDATPADDVWLSLEHSPGLAADGAVTAHPLFAEHVAFVERAREAGVLVAAGPLSDAPGHGRTVLRVPAAGAATWTAAAEEDGAVAGDLLVVTVRPWSVVTAAR